MVRNIATAGFVVLASGSTAIGALDSVPAMRGGDSLDKIYAGMGPSGSNVFTRDCNSAARRALVTNWNDIFEGKPEGRASTRTRASPVSGPRVTTRTTTSSSQACATLSA